MNYLTNNNRVVKYMAEYVNTDSSDDLSDSIYLTAAIKVVKAFFENTLTEEQLTTTMEYLEDFADIFLVELGFYSGIGNYESIKYMTSDYLLNTFTKINATDEQRAIILGILIGNMCLTKDLYKALYTIKNKNIAIEIAIESIVKSSFIEIMDFSMINMTVDFLISDDYFEERYMKESELSDICKSLITTITNDSDLNLKQKQHLIKKINSTLVIRNLLY